MVVLKIGAGSFTRQGGFTGLRCVGQGLRGKASAHVYIGANGCLVAQVLIKAELSSARSRKKRRKPPGMIRGVFARTPRKRRALKHAFELSATMKRLPNGGRPSILRNRHGRRQLHHYAAL